LPVEIAAPPPKLALRARMRADFERMLLEAAQDRAIKGGAEGVTRPWRATTVKRFVLGRIAVPAFRLFPWGLRRWAMRRVCGYPKGWPRSP
jgi:hypothetical protein